MDKKRLNVLAIGAHPDDIEFGCGATLMKMVLAGHKVCMLIMTKGGEGGDPKIRQKEQAKAAKLIGVKQVFWGSYLDTHLESDKRAISFIEGIIKKTRSEIIFVPYHNDTHQDHRIVSQNTITASRYKKSVFFFEVPTTQEFNPDIFVDITAILKNKLELLKMHASQVAKTGVERLSILESAQSCANFRGYQARVKYAEGFKPLRFLIDL